MPAPWLSRCPRLRPASMLLAGVLVLAAAGFPGARGQDRQIQMAPAQGSAEGSAAVPDAPAVPVPEALGADVLLGKWCGDTTNYVFSPTDLTVQFHTGGTRVLRIDHIKTGAGWIDVHWVGQRPDGGTNNTVFSDFSPDRNLMFQNANVGGDKGPRRRFRRC